MQQNKAFKYRLYPTEQQQTIFAQTFGCCRVVYNQLLDWRSKEYTLHGNKINYTKTSSKLTELKQDENYRWLNDVSSVALQQELRNQDKAFSNFFNKRAKYPNFKKKNNTQSFSKKRRKPSPLMAVI